MMMDSINRHNKTHKEIHQGEQLHNKTHKEIHLGGHLLTNR